MTPVFIGTYTDKGSEGIYRAAWDSVSGKLTELVLAAKLEHPSWVSIDATGRFLYAASEVVSGVVYAYSIDVETQELTLLGQQSTGGAHPCHLALSPDGTSLAVANYVGGSVAVLAVAADGTLGGAQVVQYSGKGPDVARQEAPHPHGVAFDHTGRMWVADLGLDRLTSYAVAKGIIDVETARVVQTKPGSGPRHLAFHPTLARMYVVGELDSTIMVYDMSGTGAILLATVSTRAEGALGDNRAGAIAIHLTGKYLYVTNRGDESVACYGIDVGTGALALVDVVDAQGLEPRSAAIDPSGKYLLVTDQKSDTVVTFRIDVETGKLSALNSKLEVASPTCVAFIADDKE